MKVRISYFITMAAKIVKSTQKGQITLPKEWRSKFNTDSYIIEMKDTVIKITPFYLDEEILFDAERDNDGKGISPDEMIKLLKKIK